MPGANDGRKQTVGLMQHDDEQLGFELGEQPLASGYAPNLAHIREDLGAILDQARAASETAPWDARTTRYKKIVFLQMAKWLPEAEGDQYSFEFLTELQRIEALLAA